MSKNHGGPAFPIPMQPGCSFSGHGGEVDGMTLRDYFAAKAMQGILSDQTTVSAFDAAGKRDFVQPACLVATAAYGMADVMLEERAK